jgi:hypothetical protein
MRRPVLTVDFEACNGQGTWMSYCCAVAHYPERIILCEVRATVKRPAQSYDDVRRDFWFNKHRAAYDALQAYVSEVKSAELQLVQFVQRAHQDHPFLQVVSDNPAFDLHLLNDMLMRHGYPTSNFRMNGKWCAPICTRSFIKCYRLLQGGAELPPAPVSQSAFSVDAVVGIPHTPWFDVRKILSDYFNCCDAIAAARKAVPHKLQNS